MYQAGTGILAALVPMRLAQQGFAASVVGSVSAGFSLGFLAGCLFAPFTISAIGPRYAIIGLAGINAAAAAVLWLSDYPLIWAISRTVAGFATASLFVLIEAWFAAESTQQNRGAVFGLYMVVNRLTFTAGQALLAIVDRPVPSLWIRRQPPPVNRGQRPDLLDLPRLAPAAAAGCLFHGLVTTAGPALFPVYGLQHGLSISEVAMALAAMQFGGLLLQLPLALLSDRVERRTVMAGVTLATGVLSLPFLFAAAIPLPALLVLIALWGGTPAVLYSVAAAHANDLAGDSRRIAWTSSLLLIWGIGAATGPLAASILMDWLGSPSLFAFAAAISFATTLFLLWRKVVRVPKLPN